jgi:Amt family ammonium transporter
MGNLTYDASGQLVYTSPTGVVNVYNGGDIAWTLASTALVWLMVPGVGFFYSGLLRRKNALSLIYLSVAVLGVVSFEWWFWGYSLAFSDGASPFIGDLKYFALRNVQGQPSIGSPRIPALVFCIYQCMFAAITPVIAIGAVAERGRLGPTLLFTFIWSTIVYNPLACMTWNAHGWSLVRGGLDFAGGTPVHISSGTAALAISIYLGKRTGYGTEKLAYKPHNTTYVILGTVFLWFGWFGFNGGSALSANVRAASACVVTNLAAAVGGLTWMLWDYRLERKWSAVGFCSGAVSGLVAITPASGFVGSPAAVLFGVMSGTVCNFATQLKFTLGYDDTLDIFASHAIGGVVGNLLTGLFAQASIAGLDGSTVIPGGWLDKNYMQLAWQLADSVTGLSYSFVMTTVILWIMHFTPFCRLRTDEASELIGIDESQMGEYAYDYVGLDSEVPLNDTGSITGGGREPQHSNIHEVEQASNEKRSIPSENV